MLIPFTFFPDWFQTAVKFLPFQSLSYVPVTIYLGKHSGRGLLAAIALQALWAVVLFVAGRLLWNRAMRNVTLQGG